MRLWHVCPNVTPREGGGRAFIEQGALGWGWTCGAQWSEAAFMWGVAPRGRGAQCLRPHLCSLGAKQPHSHLSRWPTAAPSPCSVVLAACGPLGWSCSAPGPPRVPLPVPVGRPPAAGARADHGAPHSVPQCPSSLVSPGTCS